MRRLSGFIQFILGFIIGVLLLAGGTATAAYYFFTKMAAPPARPVFSEEKPKPKNVAQTKTSPVPAKTGTKENKPQKPKKETPKPSPKKKEQLPAGAYRARVTWSQGLSLRAEPTIKAERVGGVGYNSELIILKYSSDRKWQKVRVPNTGQQAWIKAGNVRKVD
ncbi:MAG: SH3 domain-containing protein [Moorea sp. SIO2B7]|nr:SH3 domain-containing protein [Moorena sp. SIO2B7]